MDKSLTQLLFDPAVPDAMRTALVDVWVQSVTEDQDRYIRATAKSEVENFFRVASRVLTLHTEADALKGVSYNQADKDTLAKTALMVIQKTGANCFTLIDENLLKNVKKLTESPVLKAQANKVFNMLVAERPGLASQVFPENPTP